MGKAVSREFLIGGFSEIDTGGRDYGMGIVRIDPRLTSSDPAAARWPRHALLRLQVKKTAGARRVYAVMRLIDPADLPQDRVLPLLCLEYDDRLALGLEKGETATVQLSTAGLWGRYQYFRNHPNIVVRSYTRYTFLTAIFTAVLGAVAWALFRKFGM